MLRYLLRYTIDRSSGDPVIVAELQEVPKLRSYLDAARHARGLLDRFNSHLRPGERRRNLHSVRVLPSRLDECDGVHDWEKSCLVTQSDGGRMYDTMQCTVCGVTGKRYGLGGYVTPDPVKTKRGK